MSTDFTSAATVLDSYADVADVLRSYDYENAMQTFHQGTLLTLQGDEHSERRRVEAPLFRIRMLEQYERDTLVPALEHEVASVMAAAAGSVASTDLVPLLQRVVLRVTARLIGLDGVDSPEAAATFGSQMDRLIAAGVPAFSRGDTEALLRASEEARNEFRAQFYNPAVARRRELVAMARTEDTLVEELPADLITVLLQRGYPDADVEKEATMFTTASVATTVRESLFALRRLLHWLADHPEDSKVATEPAFLTGFIGETMRLDPILPGLFRRAGHDATLPSGRIVHAGEDLFLDIHAANRDPAVFGPDARDFNPRRPSTDGVFSYSLSFGAGPHKCMGAPLAFGATSGASTTRRGEMQQMIVGLLVAGVALDPGDPPVENAATLIREFTTFPVLLGPRPMPATGSVGQ